VTSSESVTFNVANARQKKPAGRLGVATFRRPPGTCGQQLFDVAIRQARTADTSAPPRDHLGGNWTLANADRKLAPDAGAPERLTDPSLLPTIDGRNSALVPALLQ
jgi:hypothetical protein